REPMPEPPVVALDGLHQADVAFLDQVEKRQSTSGVAPGDGDDEPQVGLDQAPAGAQVAALERLGQRDLLGGGQERHLRDLAQVHPDRVLGQAGGGVGLEVELVVRIETRGISLRVGGVLGHCCGAYYRSGACARMASSLASTDNRSSSKPCSSRCRLKFKSAFSRIAFSPSSARYRCSFQYSSSSAHSEA